MKTEIKVPSAGESVIEATVGTIFKPTGSIVKMEEEILELETDKLNQVVYAPMAGKLTIQVKTGDVVQVGRVIGYIESSEEVTKEATEMPKEFPQDKLKPELKAPSLSPQSRKSIDKALDEIRAPIESQPLPESNHKSFSDPKETRQRMSKLRRVIAERLVAVKNQTAMLTTFNELDMTAVMKVREQEQENFQKKYGVKLGYMSFFIKAVVSALEEFPEINARIEEDEMILQHFYDIAVAVSTDKGLMVPVLKKVDQLSYAEIEKTLKDLAQKAKDGSISVDLLRGGTFTITNAGQFGSLFSTPILNPPQSGILGMHNIVKRAVVIQDEIVIRPMMYLALSYDHRIVDGKTAVLFLMHIKKNLEEPTRLLLDL